MVTRGDMKTPITTAHRLDEFAAITHVAIERFVLRPVQTTNVTAFAQQCFDVVTAGGDFVHQVRPDEPGCACDEAIHFSLAKNCRAVSHVARLSSSRAHRFTPAMVVAISWTYEGSHRLPR